MLHVYNKYSFYIQIYFIGFIFLDCGGCEFFWCKMFVKSLFTFIYAVHWNLKFSEISEILLRYEFLFECQAGTIYGNRTANVT